MGRLQLREITTLPRHMHQPRLGRIGRRPGGTLHQGNIMVRFAKRQEVDLGFANVRRAAMIRHRTLPDYLFACLPMLRKRIATPPVANFSRPAVRQGT